MDGPLLLTPHLAPRVWGGRGLGEGIGEAWDLSVHAHGAATIANGPLAGRALADVDPAPFGGPIDLLAKRLDCAQDLSVQVHPKEGAPKTEAWVVLQARRGAGVYLGFEEEQTADAVRRAAEDGSLPELLRFVPVHPGECVFVPSGTVHAIGGGLLLFEIQQSADVTYRLYDWGRGRDLHLEDGLRCADLGRSRARMPARPQPDGALRLVSCAHFFVDRVDSTKPHRIDPGAKWTAVHLVAGRAALGNVRLTPGATALLPGTAGVHHLEPAGACTALVYGPGQT